MNHYIRFFLGTIVVAFCTIGCVENNNLVEESLTLEQIVYSAEIIQGDLPISQEGEVIGDIPSGSYLYIQIPSEHGYLQLATESQQQTIEILVLVAARFSEDFNTNNSGSRLAGPKCSGWIQDDADDPNSGVHRWCVYPDIFGLDSIVVLQSCVCGYCCD